MKAYLIGAVGAVLVTLAVPAQAVDTSASTDATALANQLAGTGFHLISANLTSDTQNGFFSNGPSALGLNSGVVLTTGQLSCVGSANTGSRCAGLAGKTSTLSLTFTIDSSELFFNYVFASEEYPEWVGTAFNDTFRMTLTGPNAAGINLAQLPGGAGEVSINNLNAVTNSAYYRSNADGTIPIEYDGLSTVLTASASGLTAGAQYTLEFMIEDSADKDYDSAVFIQAGTIGTIPTPPMGAVPEPATWAMMIGGFGMVGGAIRRRQRETKLRTA